MAQLFHHLPFALEKLSIKDCPHGRVSMDAILGWLENTSTNLKTLDLSEIGIGGETGGKECGERLARFLTRKDCKIESFSLWGTDLVGSRNVDVWIECLEKNQSLKKVTFYGLADDVEDVGKSEKPNTTIDAPYENCKIYWDGTTFPDATLSIEQVEALKETLLENMMNKTNNNHVIESTGAFGHVGCFHIGTRKNHSSSLSKLTVDDIMQFYQKDNHLRDKNYLFIITLIHGK